MANLRQGQQPSRREAAEEVLRLVVRHQEALFRYIYALVLNEEDTRDVLQETCIALSRKADAYDPAKPFLSWAYAFASIEVLKQRDRRRRDRPLFSRETLQRLATERASLDGTLQARLSALDGCLHELPPPEAELIRAHYLEKTKTEDLLAQLGISRRTLFRKLDRIRQLLFDCINRRIACEEAF